MPSKKSIELQDMTDERLLEEFTEIEVQYSKLKMDHAIKGLENPLKLKDIRRDVARMKTEIRSRELKAMTPEQLAGRSKKRARRRKY